MLDDEEEQLIDKRYEKEEIRRILDKHIAEYMRRGGKITHLEFGEMTQDIDMREVSFRTRMEKEVVRVKAEKETNREKIIRKISAGKPINLFGEE